MHTRHTARRMGRGNSQLVVNKYVHMVYLCDESCDIGTTRVHHSACTLSSSFEITEDITFIPFTSHFSCTDLLINFLSVKTIFSRWKIQNHPFN